MTQISNENLEKITNLIREILQTALDEVGEPDGLLPSEKALSWYMIVTRAATTMIETASDILLELTDGSG